jgi:hypothetical protein
LKLPDSGAHESFARRTTDLVKSVYYSIFFSTVFLMIDQTGQQRPWAPSRRRQSALAGAFAILIAVMDEPTKSPRAAAPSEPYEGRLERALLNLRALADIRANRAEQRRIMRNCGYTLAQAELFCPTYLVRDGRNRPTPKLGFFMVALAVLFA